MLLPFLLAIFCPTVNLFDKKSNVKYPTLTENGVKKLYPHFCYNYTMSGNFQDDIYLKRGEKTVVIVKNVTDVVVVEACSPYFYTHLKGNELFIYVNFLKPFKCPFVVTKGEDLIQLNFLEAVTEQPCTKDQEDEIVANCIGPCHCILLSGQPVRKCTFPWSEGQYCDKTINAVDSRTVIDHSKSPHHIKAVLNMGPAQFCRSYHSTPAVSTEELRKMSSSYPEADAVETFKERGFFYYDKISRISAVAIIQLAVFIWIVPKLWRRVRSFFLQRKPHDEHNQMMTLSQLQDNDETSLLNK